VQKGILKSLGSVLKMKEARILAVALEGIENILKSGQEHFPKVRHKLLLILFLAWSREQVHN